MNINLNLKVAFHNHLFCLLSCCSRSFLHSAIRSDMAKAFLLVTPGGDIRAAVEVRHPKEHANAREYLRTGMLGSLVLSVAALHGSTESMWVIGVRTKFCHRRFLCVCAQTRLCHTAVSVKIKVAKQCRVQNTSRWVL